MIKLKFFKFLQNQKCDKNKKLIKLKFDKNKKIDKN